MAGGLAFDPSEYASFKASRADGPRSGEQGSAAPVFDPADFDAFKRSRQGPASFSDRLDAAPPSSQADAAPRVSGDTPGRSIAGDQGAADALYAGLRRTADEALIGKPSALNTATAALFGAGQGASLNLAGNAAAGVATVLGNLDKVGIPNVPGYGDGSRSFSENYDRFRDFRDAYGRQAPVTTAASTLAGAVAATPLMPGLPIAEGANLATRAGLYGLTGAGYGAAAEAIGEHDGVKALEGGAKGFAGGAVLGPVVEKVAPPVVAAAGKALAPILERFGVGGVRAVEGGFTPRARAVLLNAGLDADNLPPDLADHIGRVFAAKGATPAALREAQAAEFGIGLTRGQATQDPRAASLEARALVGRSGERAQGVAQSAVDRQAGEVAAAGERLQGMAAGTFDRIAAPRDAYEAVAERARQAAADTAERQSIATRGVDDALRAVRGRGETDAIDGAAAAAQGVRDAAEQGRAAYRAAYGEVGQIPGTFVPGAMDRVGSRVRQRLGPDVPIDDVLTPAAHRALQDLDDVPGLFNLGPGEGPNLQQVEQLRKRLVARYGSTTQNPTDRRALGRVIEGLDQHVENAMGAGAFNRTPGRASNPAADGFPGFAGGDVAPAPFPAAGGPPARSGEPETLTAYLSRSGGVPLDGEARASDLNRFYRPGAGTLARRDAPSWDDIRVRLHEEGFLPPEADGTFRADDVRDMVLDALHRERTGGRPMVRLGDEAGIGGRRAAETIEAQNADHAVAVDRQARRMAIDLEGYGIGARDLDRGALNHAAEQVVLGRHTGDAVDAYEAALAREGTGAARGGAPADAIPFDGPTAPAASDSLPIGDMAPLEAMQRARGLFREHKQAFSPRGPGDTAGNNLRRIVERDASPNEVASMLFGSPGTGRVGAGQVQTLARLREAVGGDSDAWRATQQALIARHLGGEGRDLGQRLDYLLRGEGKTLTRFLTEEQRTGLGRLRGAVAQAESAGAPAPTWASDLERSGFDPNRIAHGLFGGAEIGSRVGAANEARAAKAFLGEGSPEWAGLRQAAIQRLTGAGDGPGGGGRVADQVRAFVDGPGKGVAEALFSKDELGEIRRFGMAVRATLAPDGTLRPDAGGRLDAVRLAFDRLGHIVALHVGGLPGVAASIGAAKAREMAMSRFAAARARSAYEGGAPRLALPPPGYATAAGGATGRALEAP